MTDEDRTVALIAGNILTGRMPFGGGGHDSDLKAVTWAVHLSKLIVAETMAQPRVSERPR
jgi:hypothetical protein